MFSPTASITASTTGDKNALKNLLAIKREDPFAESIISQTNHAALFSFNAKKGEWQKTDTDGPLFIYRRMDEPYYSMLIANRQNPKNFIQTITPKLKFKYESPYVFIYNPNGAIRGIWFYGEDECKRVYNLLSILRKTKNEPTPAAAAPKPVPSPPQRLPQLHLQQTPAGFGKPSVRSIQQQMGKFHLLAGPTTVAALRNPEEIAIPDEIEEDDEEDDEIGEEEGAPDTDALYEEEAEAYDTAADEDAVAEEVEQEEDDDEPVPSAYQSEAALAPVLAVAETGGASPSVVGSVIGLSKTQLLQAIQHLLATDASFIEKIHEAYINSLRSHLKS